MSSCCVSLCFTHVYHDYLARCFFFLASLPRMSCKTSILISSAASRAYAYASPVRVRFVFRAARKERALETKTTKKCCMSLAPAAAGFSTARKPPPPPERGAPRQQLPTASCCPRRRLLPLRHCRCRISTLCPQQTPSPTGYAYACVNIR